MRAFPTLKSHKTTKQIPRIVVLFTLLVTVSVALMSENVATLDENAPQTTQTIFTNTGQITIGVATTPYPSTISVSGIAGNISNAPGSVRVTLCNFTHTFPDDVGIVLVGPTNAALLIQDGAGDDPDMSSITYTLSDTGSTRLPDTTNWTAGTYKPTSYYTDDTFPVPGPGMAYGNPGPAGSGTATFSSTFGGTNPNGLWNLYVVDFVTADVGSIGCGWSLEINPGSGIVPQHVVDFDGDGKTDPTVVRNTGGGAMGQITWFILNSSGSPSTTATNWGIATDLLVPADYDGDNKTDVCVWRPGPPFGSFFYILQSSTGTLRTDNFGQFGDDPTVPGDYDGDNKEDVAVYRSGAALGDPSFWYYRSSVNGLIVGTQWGQNGDFPAPGDYDGDGKNDFVVQRADVGGQARFYLRQSTAGNTSFVFGTPTDAIVPGDYDGDGKCDIAIVRGTGGALLWFARRSSDGITTQTQFGTSATDFPCQGDWDGDAKTDVAIWRPNADPTQNLFYYRRSATGVVAAVQWGQNGDYPVANYNTH